MYNDDQLVGILISIAKPEIHVSRADNTNIGYRVRVRVNMRGSEPFLLGVNRTLEQKGIHSKYKSEEHKSRPRPILTIGGIVNIWKLIQLVPETLPDAKDCWGELREIIKIIDSGEHHTLEGLDKILRLKGEI
tara:strand:+ start:1067 stop:1465 length:399 start_codon:yes stop_codon:yes gene_type:complete